MPIFNNIKNTENVCLGYTEIKEVYYNNILVYKDKFEEAKYNLFVFDTSLGNTKTVKLQNWRAGDRAYWNGVTDWGDGTVNSSLTHTYTTNGKYTVKTKWSINNYMGIGDSNTQMMLIACDNLNRNITDFDWFFDSCINLKTVTLMSKVGRATSAFMMFNGCFSLTNFDALKFGTQNITHMGGMFQDCLSLEELNMIGWDTSSVEFMNNMFYGCQKLTPQVSHLNVSNVVAMNGMFASCKVDGSQFKNWDVSSVIDMYNMFMESTITNCLDLSSWDVSNVEQMFSMFANCNPKDGIDISNWNINDDATTQAAFYGVDIGCVMHNNVSYEDWQRMIAG
ncbi:MAG: BspA family leucine-rich repeat surface protein [Lachnospiraceae bacterium]|nr:BspA family leucine-rich repeat surface protein [Lachnospiraceae bacterium]